MSHPRLFIAVALCSITLAGCGSAEATKADEGSSPVHTVSAATLTPGDPVPAPVGPVVLTVSGAIATTNAGPTLQFDMATLERLGLVEYKIDDRLAEGRVATFRGVLMERILAVAGARTGATTLRTTALNDYKVSIPVSDVTASPVLVASTVDGQRMPVDRFGPLRMIYPYGSFGLEPPEADEKLIWQLADIEVT